VGYSRDAYKILESIGSVIEKDCTREELISMIPEVDILITRLRNKIDNEVLSKANKLKIIVTATTGLNHIDLNMTNLYGVKVLSLKGEREFLDTLTATAELTWSLLLSLYRKIPDAVKHVKNGDWNRDLFKGRQLKGKTLGIVGYGRLGSIVAQYGQAFQMNVIAADPFVNDFPENIKKVTLKKLLQLSDVITLHVNYDESTHKMFNDELFKYIKTGAVLVNTSRGELIDESAMLRALNSGRLLGVALDVLYGEAENKHNWLQSSNVWKKSLVDKNIILVPHLGGATKESMMDTEIFMAQKLIQNIDL
jgi:D-3-phosphoglycerate dehydrogenase